MFDKKIGTRTDSALLVLRIALGFIFLVYGWLHVTGLEQFISAFDGKFGFPAPVFLATITAWGELLGGIAVLVGVFTRYAGALLAFIMAVAAVFVKLPNGLQEGRDIFGLTGFWDLDLTLFAVGIALLLAGAGKYSVDAWLAKRSES